MRFGKNILETSNPALKNHGVWQEGLEAGGVNTASVSGVVNKTGLLTSIAVGGGMFGSRKTNLHLRGHLELRVLLPPLSSTS